MFSVGTILSSLHFLKRLTNEPIDVDYFKRQRAFFYTLPSVVEDILSKSGLIVKRNGMWYLTDKSITYVIDEKLTEKGLSNDIKMMIRSFLKELILTLKPTFSKDIYKGRNECINGIKDNQEQKDLCELFDFLGLLKGTDKETIKWWDGLSYELSPNETKKLEIGRIGERLSIKYEERRTGKTPRWEALYSNFSGYDILSSLSIESMAPLKIEVKASNTTFGFYLSKKEWQISKNEDHLFHFWYLPKKELYAFKLKEIEEHIPINQGKGYWEKCYIPLDENIISNKKRP